MVIRFVPHRQPLSLQLAAAFAVDLQAVVDLI